MVKLNIKEYIIEHINEEIKRQSDHGNFNALCQRVANLQREVSANNMGMNNVYAEFNKIIDGSFLRDWKIEKEKLQSEIALMKRQIIENNEYITKCHKKMAVINDLYSLRDIDPKLVCNISKIAQALKDIDE